MNPNFKSEIKNDTNIELSKLYDMSDVDVDYVTLTEWMNTRSTCLLTSKIGKVPPKITMDENDNIVVIKQSGYTISITYLY